MEQKTEASQAVERAIPTWRERAASDPTYWNRSSPVRFMRAEIDDLRAALKAQPAPLPPEYGPVEVVGDLVRNLLTLDQSTPIFAAFHVDYQGKRACRTRPVWTSRERVVDGKWVDSKRTDVPYSVVVWAKPQADEKAQPAPTEAQGGKLLELFKHTLGSLALHDMAEAERIGKLYRGEGIAAQGEDSARLDAAHASLLAAVKVYSHGYMQDEADDEEDCVCGTAQHTEAKEVFAAIAEVERASSETGGVKS